ncbi:hypothetical protein [Vibrio caribbeanicus]|uniref:Lipoprotein n=1 Tax=Vibrio caribbeanicus ATCC BAA-2122 TaxID=796620 RepID=E3BKN2_9VIBR|nr:hypothetical protein [Vibrio caribbeanicus]EFP96226.1 hypothetical protein VIBC2010_11694 [Vibrio caribbeanicus ATCC BAA-2122]
MKKLLGVTLISTFLLGCFDRGQAKDEANPISQKIETRYEGLYISKSGDKTYALVADDDQGDVFLFNFTSSPSPFNEVIVPQSFIQTQNSIVYSAYKQSSQSDWGNSDGQTLRIQFSENTAYIEQFDVSLGKVQSLDLSHANAAWNFNEGSFSFYDSVSSNTYKGTLEQDSSGYWELDNSKPFSDDSSNLSSSDADMVLFIYDNVTYAMISDKNKERFVLVDVR